MGIKIKRLNDLAKLPKKAHDTDAGWDLYAATSYDIIIEPHQTVLIGTGLCIEPPKGYFGAIVARSGLATKSGLAPANKIGVCDEAYTGEYKVALHNHSDNPQVVGAGERIAQLIFLPYINGEWEEVDDLQQTDRGASGFGASGKN